MPTETSVKSLVINRVDTYDTLKKLKEKGLLAESDICAVDEPLTPEAIGAATVNSVGSATTLANEAKAAAATAQSKADSAYSLANSKVGGLSDLNITASAAELNHTKGVTSAIQNQLDNKLGKTTYEYNTELALGQNGKVCIGKFPMYDSNVSVEIKSTTNQTYNGTLIIATQNINTTGGGSHSEVVYGDADNKLAESIRIHYGSGSNVFSVYIDLPGWSKNLLHIQCVALAGAPTNIATAVSAIPSEATIIPVNVLKAQFDNKAPNVMASSATDGLMSKADKAKLDTVEENANDYSLPAATATIRGGVTIGSNITLNGDQISLTKSNVTKALGYTPLQTAPTYTLGSFGVTASKDEINVLKGIDVTTTELNRIKGVTDNIQSQLDKKLNTSGGNISGHVYLTGANTSSSTGNTSQVIFGTSENNHVAISSNDNALVINPTSSTTTNQIVLYLDKPSQFPSGINGNASSATKVKNSLAIKLNGGSTEGTNLFTFNGSTAKSIDITPSAIGAAPNSLVSQSTAGLMSALDKIKLDGIAEHANKYTYTLPEATSAVLGGVMIGNNITNTNGKISLSQSNVTTALGYTPAKNEVTSTYSAGLAPKLNGSTSNFLRGDGTWVTPPDTKTTSLAASAITAGTFAGRVVANVTAQENIGTAQLRNVEVHTTDLTVGTSSLATGAMYLVYE